MIEGTYEFTAADAPARSVTITRLGNEYEFRFHDPDITLVLDESDVVGLWKWLGQNVGALGESWKSIVDSKNKWPKNMSRKDLLELAETQQVIIEKLRHE
jgi:hypothetical protein